MINIQKNQVCPLSKITIVAKAKLGIASTSLPVLAASAAWPGLFIARGATTLANTALNSTAAARVTDSSPIFTLFGTVSSYLVKFFSAYCM